MLASLLGILYLTNQLFQAGELAMFAYCLYRIRLGFAAHQRIQGLLSPVGRSKHTAIIERTK
jgi:hypothetical protein